MRWCFSSIVFYHSCSSIELRSHTESILDVLDAVVFAVMDDAHDVEATTEIDAMVFDVGIGGKAYTMLFAGIYSLDGRRGRTSLACLDLNEDHNVVLRSDDVQFLPSPIRPIAFQDAVTLLLKVFCGKVFSFVTQVVMCSHFK